MNRQLPSLSLSLCLNPDCPQQHRVCSGETHRRCDGWVHSLAWLRNQPNRKTLFSDEVNVDYLMDPIGAIYLLEQRSIGWEGALVGYFQQIRSRIIDQLAATYQRCRSSIEQHMLANRQIFDKINFFSQGDVMRDNEKYFHQYLDGDLRAIQQQGRVSFPDQTTLNSFFQTITREVRAIEQTLFVKEDVCSFNQRSQSELKKKKLYYFTQNASPVQVNEKLQELESMCGRQLRITELCHRAQVECLFCPYILTLQDSSTKACRRRCRLSILHHMCTTHTKEILQRSRGGTSIRISLEELRGELRSRQVRRVAVVDRQNVHFAIPTDPSSYCIEVVSLNGVHLAMGRYLLAESKGRDAADILVMMALYQMSLLRIKEVTLYTKDHFGMTLVPIFAQVGLTVIIATKPNI